MDQRTLAKPAEHTLILRRSRFVGYARPIEDMSSWDTFHMGVKQTHRRATHCTYAYVLTPHQKKSYDAGEPKGSAGKPILEVLQSAQLHHAAVIVVRYFGGTRLGLGGLIRAYAQTAKGVIQAAGYGTRQLHSYSKFTLPHRHLATAQHLLQNVQAIDIKATFSEQVTLTAWVPDTKMRCLTHQLKNRTHDLMITTGEKRWKVVAE